MTHTARRPIDSLFQRIAGAEDSAYERYDQSRQERHLRIDTGCGQTVVRVSTFGPETGRPPVLLLHGIGSAHVLAAPLLPSLAGRHVVAIDWPGHGLSGSCILTPAHDMRAHACAVVASVLDALALPRVDLVGHSMGAQFGLYAALGLPHRVRRLVLLGAPGAAFAGIRPLAAMKLLAVPHLGPLLLSRPMSDRAFDRFNDLALGPGALDGEPEVRAALRALSRYTGNAPSLASYFCAMVRGGRIREGVGIDERELGRVSQPTLLVWGDEDVFLHPVDAARSIVAIRDAHLVRVPAAGHAPWLQAPELVGRVVERHLDG